MSNDRKASVPASGAKQARVFEATGTAAGGGHQENDPDAPPSISATADTHPDQLATASERRSETIDEQFARKAVAKAVQDTIRDEPYSHEATSEWTNSIVESLVKTLVQVDRDNKYIGAFFT